MEESGKCEASRRRIDKLEKYIRISAKYFDIGRVGHETKTYIPRDARPPREKERRMCVCVCVCFT